MTNKIIIHLNKRFHVELDAILKVVKKKHGSIWVYFKDKNGQTKIAVAKQEMGNLLMIINTNLIMMGRKPILAIYEK